MYDLQGSSKGFHSFYEKVSPYLHQKQIIFVMNKCDIVETIPSHLEKFIQERSDINCHPIIISAKQKLNVDTLRRCLVELALLPNIHHGDVIVTNIRHYEALSHALNAIQRVKHGLTNSISSDFISQDLRECIFHLNDILGEVTTDEVLGNIFKHFCIGK